MPFPVALARLSLPLYAKRAPLMRAMTTKDTPDGSLDSKENSEAPTSQFDGILNVLTNAQAGSAKSDIAGLDTVSSVLSESVSRRKKQADGASLFDFNALTASISLKQAPHNLYINATPNNTILTLTRPDGAPLVWTSGGSAGFKKAARSGYEAGHQAAIQLLEKMQVKNLQVRAIHIVLKGFGPGRDAAFKALVPGANWTVRRITDATPIPFGGCRPKKARRL